MVELMKNVVDNKEMMILGRTGPKAKITKFITISEKNVRELMNFRQNAIEMVSTRERRQFLESIIMDERTGDTGLHYVAFFHEHAALRLINTNFALSSQEKRDEKLITEITNNYGESVLDIILNAHGWIADVMSHKIERIKNAKTAKTDGNDSA